MVFRLALEPDAPLGLEPVSLAHIPPLFSLEDVHRGQERRVAGELGRHLITEAQKLRGDDCRIPAGVPFTIGQEPGVFSRMTPIPRHPLGIALGCPKTRHQLKLFSYEPAPTSRLAGIYPSLDFGIADPTRCQHVCPGAESILLFGIKF
jgi:hypothetical protein